MYTYAYLHIVYTHIAKNLLVVYQNQLQNLIIVFKNDIGYENCAYQYAMPFTS